MFLVSYETVTTKTDPFRSVSIQLAQRQPRQDVPRHTSSASVSVSGTAMGAVQLVAGRLGSVWPCHAMQVIGDGHPAQKLGNPSNGSTDIIYYHHI